MVIFELAKAGIAFVVENLGWNAVPVAVVAALLVGLHYSREASAMLMGIARWLRIGSLVAVGLAGLVVVGIATGAISLDSGLVARLIDAVQAFIGGHS